MLFVLLAMREFLVSHNFPLRVFFFYFAPPPPTTFLMTKNNILIGNGRGEVTASQNVLTIIKLSVCAEK